MTVQELRNNCNLIYLKTIEELENSGDVKIVRNGFLDTIQLLLEISQADLSLKMECEIKARKLLDVVKNISSVEDYDNAYMILFGKILPQKTKSNKKVHTEDVNNIQSKENKKDIADTISNSPERTNKKQNPRYEDKKNASYNFNWDALPAVSFDDVAGLEEVKRTVKTKVLLPLQNPQLFEGYTKKNGGGILLYGPPGTGKTMIAAAIAHEINAKFCSIGPSDLLTTGVGNSEKLIALLFKEARSFPCSVIFFDEFESLCPVSTYAQHARQIRSELLKQMQGLDSYESDNESILLLVGATNKPWDIDPAFVRPGRLGTKIYVDLPDEKARTYMIKKTLDKIKAVGSVTITNDIDIDNIVEKTEGYNGADVSNLIEKVQEISIIRAQNTDKKIILNEDFVEALKQIKSSVQDNDIKKLEEWKQING